MDKGAAMEYGRGRLIAWLVFVGVLALASYGARLSDTKAPDDIAYRYSSSVAALIQYGFILGILLLIARGFPRREVFALRRPESWPRSLGLAVLALLAIYLAAVAYDQVLSVLGDWNPTEEQGLVPDRWDSSRAGAFVAFFLVVTLVAPAVEELSYRGLGLSLLTPYGVGLAILVTGVLFGAAHGLIVALPVLAIFGIVVGWLRVRTNSIYPPMLLHATFNGTALLVSVSGAAG
ncbi:MAG: lysostaphin resistance A-like protein [Gaiellaceae bacterium]